MKKLKDPLKNPVLKILIVVFLFASSFIFMALIDKDVSGKMEKVRDKIAEKQRVNVPYCGRPSKINP